MSTQLKNLVWKYTPGFLHFWLRNIYFFLELFPQILYDAVRFYRYSGLNKSRQYQSEQAARIVMTYHQLEKGLSYAHPRPGFGRDVVTRLFGLLEPFVTRYGMIPPATTSVAVLNQYISFNDRFQIDMRHIKNRLDALLGLASIHPTIQEGGILRIKKDDLQVNINAGFKSMFLSRYSVRHFAGGQVPLADIGEAVRVAQKTPSVCNRQSWRVHVYQNPIDIKNLLNLQAGSRGFGEQASAVLIITSDLTTFVDVAERYQSWIDGGMFAMSLTLALHAQGYGSCCLNWSKKSNDDRALRKMTNILPQEQVIMLMAVGTLPDEFNVAYSTRKHLEEVLFVH